MASPVKYKDALATADKLQRSGDPELSRAGRVVSDYLDSRPNGLEECLQTLSEGFPLKRVPLELTAIASKEQLFSLRKPFSLKISRKENYYLVDSPTYLAHATSTTATEALGNYMDEFVSHFEWLTAHAAELSPPLEKELDKLRRQFSRLA